MSNAIWTDESLAVVIARMNDGDLVAIDDCGNGNDSYTFPHSGRFRATTEERNQTIEILERQGVRYVVVESA